MFKDERLGNIEPLSKDDLNRMFCSEPEEEEEVAEDEPAKTNVKEQFSQEINQLPSISFRKYIDDGNGQHNIHEFSVSAWTSKEAVASMREVLALALDYEKEVLGNKKDDKKNNPDYTG